jgi:hypothetical protein
MVNQCWSEKIDEIIEEFPVISYRLTALPAKIESLIKRIHVNKRKPTCREGGKSVRTAKEYH